MKINNFIIGVVLFVMSGYLSGCVDNDEFGTLNSDPASVSEPDVRFLVTKSIQEIYNNDYTLWFYTYNGYVHPYTQALTSSTEGNGTTFNEGGLSGTHNIMSALNPGIDARIRIDAMEEADKSAYSAMSAITYATQIYIGLVNLDYRGGMAYEEAGLAPYTDPPLYTPTIDDESKLFDLWLAELDAAIVALQLEDQFSIGSQDMIYSGDYVKWAKFCNLLKLRVAARLVNQDRDKAISIVEEVSQSIYMDSVEDDFLFNEGVDYGGTNNGVTGSYGGQNLINFLRDVRDPRLRFIFRKNNMNPEVINAIVATNGVDGLPTQIKSIINLTADNKFESWKDDYPEPWGRYWGVPVSTTEITNREYFQQSNEFYATNNGASKKTYTWSSLFEEKNQRTKFGYTYPTEPNGDVLEVTGGEVPLYVLLGSAAETSLYFAEFKLLGATLSKSAQEYLNEGVEFSVTRMDMLAELHEAPYYDSDPVLDNPEEGATKLQDGEIDALLLKEALVLSGSTAEQLEKVYIQQYVNNLFTPGDLWTTVRRSGVPMRGSAYFAWEEFAAIDLDIPRRVSISAPEDTDLMYDNLMEYYNSVGFTLGSTTPSVLSSERLWFDTENPEYGEGPKL